MQCSPEKRMLYGTAPRCPGVRRSLFNYIQDQQVRNVTFKKPNSQQVGPATLLERVQQYSFVWAQQSDEERDRLIRNVQCMEVGTCFSGPLASQQQILARIANEIDTHTFQFQSTRLWRSLRVSVTHCVTHLLDVSAHADHNILELMSLIDCHFHWKTPFGGPRQIPTHVQRAVDWPTST